MTTVVSAGAARGSVAKSELMRANAARDVGDWAGAAEHYRRYLKIKPEAFAIWVQLGHALKESGRRVDALVAYNKALARRPDNADLLLNLGHLHKLMGHRDEAVGLYRRSWQVDGNLDARTELNALGIDPGPGVASPGGVANRTSSGRSGGGSLALKAARLFNARQRELQASGDAARDRRDWADAARCYGAYLDTRPDSFPIRVQYGHALKELGDRAGAGAAYARALKLNPADADLHLQIGHLHKLMGRRDEAITAYRQSWRIDANSLARHELRNLGVDTGPAGAPAAASVPLRSSGRPGRGKNGHHLAAGDAARDVRDWPAAAGHYRAFLDARPDHFAIWVQYGHALKETGDRIGARAAYLRAISINPADADAQLQLGHVLKVMGERAQAEAAYAEALRLDPGFLLARDELMTLRRGGDDLTRPEASILGPVAANPDRPWLPGSLGRYWLPQRLRDYLVEMTSTQAVNAVEYLMAAIHARETQGESFFASAEWHDLLANLRRLNAERTHLISPDASVIIPVYNNLVYTITCIYSVLLQKDAPSFEIIVGDDGSNDATFDVVSSLGAGIRVVRHAQNGGFLSNCNLSAIEACGQYLIFLNNDTIALPGWLKTLIDTFEQHEGVGFAGSKLLNADGTLQEAGGIFWSDGSAWNFGRGQDPRASEFNYFKDADYCSGASIAVPRDLWDQLGGFDPLYSPAYCEDADLAFRVRAAGYRSVYQPRSALIHHEGKSHGVDVGSGVKAYQVVNGKKLYERWRDVLTTQHFPNGQDVFAARDRSRGKPHILFIDHYVPQWDRDAGSRSVFNYVSYFLKRGFQITFWPDNLNMDPDYTREMENLGVEVIYSHRYLGKFDQWISENGNWIDYVFASRPHVSIKYLESIRKNSKAKIFYYGHDLHWKRMLKEYDITKNEDLLRGSDDSKRLEESVFVLSDCIMYPSLSEKLSVSESFPDKTSLEIPVYIFSQPDFARGRRQIDRITEPGGTEQVLFVGGFAHGPNLDAMLWFLDEVEPILRALRPTVNVLIVGSNVPDRLQALARPGVEILGRVSDGMLRDLHDRSAALIVPLRYGAGVKGKVVDAFAHGLPVISTDIGVQGVEEPDQVAFVANDPQAFADAIVSALADRTLAASKARKALDFVERRYTETAVDAIFRDHMPRLPTS